MKHRLQDGTTSLAYPSNIESPSFGQANQPHGVGALGGTGFSESADNRRLELQTRFTF